MKYIKLFEDFQNTDFIETFLDEVQKSIPTNFEFSWNIDIEENGDTQGFLFVNLSSLDTNLTLDWYIDLDNPSIRMISRGETAEGEDTSENSYSMEIDNIKEGLEFIKADISKLLSITERKKSARYKGRKIPGKYLSGPHPGKMKKEIDTYAGKDTYKKDWDADYKSGKGGKGKRVKTKKSAATKAYQKMFGDK